MSNALVSLLIVFTSLMIGWVIRLRTRARFALSSDGVLHQRLGRLDQRAERFQRLHVTVLNPFIMASAFWVFDPSSATLITLPLLGVLGLLVGGALGLFAARRMKLPPDQAGSLFVCGMFSNLGSIGALICFFFFGEAGFILASVYRLLEHLVYYSIGFPVSNLIGKDKPLRLSSLVRESAGNPLTFLPFAGILFGIALRLVGIERPELFETINSFLIPGSAALLMLSLGLKLEMGNVMLHPKLWAVVAGIKFAAVPAVVGVLAYLLGYHGIDEGLPFKVAIVQASTPVAFVAMVPATLFNLDEGVAQAAWVSSMVAMAVVVPGLYLLLGVG